LKSALLISDAERVVGSNDSVATRSRD